MPLHLPLPYITPRDAPLSPAPGLHEPPPALPLHLLCPLPLPLALPPHPLIHDPARLPHRPAQPVSPQLVQLRCRQGEQTRGKRGLDWQGGWQGVCQGAQVGVCCVEVCRGGGVLLGLKVEVG